MGNGLGLILIMCIIMAIVFMALLTELWVTCKPELRRRSGMTRTSRVKQTCVLGRKRMVAYWRTSWLKPPRSAW